MAAVLLFEEIEAPPACCSPVLDRHKGEELSAYKAIWQFQTRYVPEMEHMLKLPNLFERSCPRPWYFVVTVANLHSMSITRMW